MKKIFLMLLGFVVMGVLVLGISGETYAQELGQALVTVRVTTGEGAPMANVVVAKKFSETGSTSYFPTNSPRINTDVNGEISAYFNVGTTLYLQARVNGSSSEWQMQTVQAAGNLYEFSTTTVYITSTYNVSFGGSTGQARWLNDNTRHIFPGTYVFHFNGLGRINLPVSGSTMNLEENGIEYKWLPPVYDGKVIKNPNANNPFKFQIVIAGFPIIMDNYYDEELVSLNVAGKPMSDLEYDEDKAEFKANFRVRDYPGLGDGYKTAVISYSNVPVSTLGFYIEVK
ncbi:MAG: hypothetical protein WBA71_05395 [Candidatus Humimicrobiia bacterium]